MINMSTAQIVSKFADVSEPALISLKSKGYRFIIWNDHDKNFNPLFAKSFDQTVSLAKDIGKGALAAIMI